MVRRGEHLDTVRPMAKWNAADHYDEYPLIEEQLESELDISLDPRGPDMLFDLVKGFGLPTGAIVVDLGCGEGTHALRLADDGFAVTGVDPSERHVAVCTEKAAARASRATFVSGRAEEIPFGDNNVDLVWCRDTLVHTDIDQAYKEIFRVLKPGGRALTYQAFVTDDLDPHEAAFLLPIMGVVATSATIDDAERAIAGSGLHVDERVDIGTEWSEYTQENGGRVAQKMLHLARMRRRKEEYVRKYGQVNYDVKVGDCLWHVYLMIGKMTRRAYCLSKP